MSIWRYLQRPIRATRGKLDRVDKAVSEPRLAPYYVTGLLLIGSVSGISYLVQRSVLSTTVTGSMVINKSGRQRMYSQRIASLASQYRAGDASAGPELGEEIAGMRRAERELSLPYVADSAHGSAHLLHELYFEGSTPLEAQVESFLTTAGKLAQLPPGDPSGGLLLARLNAEARRPLLQRLHQVVDVHQHEMERRLATLARIQLLLLGLMLTALAFEYFIIFRPMTHRFGAYSGGLVALAKTDQLTSVANRYGYEERSLLELERMRRYRHDLSLLLIDVDHFKMLNDNYGHQAGDVALQELGGCLRAAIRPTDLLGRVGGEEFALLLPETSLSQAAILAERLRARAGAMRIRHGEDTLSLTISIGVAVVCPETDGLEQATLVADRLLYAAKKAGRNRVVCQESGSETIHTQVRSYPVIRPASIAFSLPA